MKQIVYLELNSDDRQVRISLLTTAGRDTMTLPNDGQLAMRLEVPLRNALHAACQKIAKEKSTT